MEKNRTPNRIDKLNETEMRIAWNTGEEYALNFLDLRFFCPCAVCVDEHTGERTIQRNAIPPNIRPTGVQIVGKYAAQIQWSDQHSTGIYHFDLLYELCRKTGRTLN